MSRSRKKHPISGFTKAESEKQDKRDANRVLRRMTREQVRKGQDVLPIPREVSNPWLMAKDGKRAFSPERFPQVLRK